MIKAIILLAVFVSLLFSGRSQNLSGTWEGSTSDGAAFRRISMVHIGDSCYGYSYDEGPGYCKVNFEGAYNKTEKKFTGQAIDFISRTPDHVLIITTLQYEKEGRSEYLYGEVKAKSFLAKMLSLGIGTYGRLKKISNAVDSTIYIKASAARLLTADKNDSIKSNAIKKDTAVNAAPIINDSIVTKKIFEDAVTKIKDSRKTVVTKTITTSADSVKIILYDDGEIDGDIVTIFDNGKIVVNKLTLSKEPYQVNLVLPQTGSKHTIELMAENEGSIPPNTAYMLVLAGKERVEVKVSSDKLSNAAIVIQKQP